MKDGNRHLVPDSSGVILACCRKRPNGGSADCFVSFWTTDTARVRRLVRALHGRSRYSQRRSAGSLGELVKGHANSGVLHGHDREIPCVGHLPYRVAGRTFNSSPLTDGSVVTCGYADSNALPSYEMRNDSASFQLVLRRRIRSGTSRQRGRMVFIKLGRVFSSQRVDLWPTRPKNGFELVRINCGRPQEVQRAVRTSSGKKPSGN
jgi:hypothetical protein